jgi:predicted anti-sigma-YlaC factor YlaD
VGLFLLAGCSTVKRAAVGSLADALSSGGNSYASDEDPELIRQAIPFSLKLMESTLEQTPEHRGLLLACCSGFTQYGYAFVIQEADETEARDFASAEQQRVRARKLFLRARRYGLRGLELSAPGIGAQLARDPVAAASRLKRDDVPLLYWTAASWGAAVGISKDDPALVSEIPQLEALIDRALALDEDWGDGSLHSFLITYEMQRQGLKGDPTPRARKHYERAVALSGGKLAGPHVSWAEAVCVERRDAAGFDEALRLALAVEIEASPAHRLENLVMQRRARWLQSRRDELFLNAGKSATP